jgi:hypothetical protein
MVKKASMVSAGLISLDAKAIKLVKDEASLKAVSQYRA